MALGQVTHQYELSGPVAQLHVVLALVPTPAVVPESVCTALVGVSCTDGPLPAAVCWNRIVAAPELQPESTRK